MIEKLIRQAQNTQLARNNFILPFVTLGSSIWSCLGTYFKFGAIQKLCGQDEGGGGQKKSVFVHAQGIKTVHAGERVKKW